MIGTGQRSRCSRSSPVFRTRAMVQRLKWGLHRKRKRQKRRNGDGSAAKSPKKKKTLAKNRVLDRACFICPNKKKANSRFCLVHNPPAEAIKSQAVAKNELQAYESVMYSKEKAALAIGQFMMDNPPGKFRKKLIDFAQ